MGHFLLNHPVMQALGGIPFSNDNYRRPVAPLVFYGQQNKGSKAQWLMRKNLRGSLMSLFSSVKLKAQWTFSFGMISTLFARMRFVSPRLSHNHYVLKHRCFFSTILNSRMGKKWFFRGDNLLLYTKKVFNFLCGNENVSFDTSWWFHRNMSHDLKISLFEAMTLQFTAIFQQSAEVVESLIIRYSKHKLRQK